MKRTRQQWNDGMNYFINFNPIAGISINPFMVGYLNMDIKGLVEHIHDRSPSCCELEGSKAALEDGSLWRDSDKEIIEILHAAICNFEREKQ